MHRLRAVEQHLASLHQYANVVHQQIRLNGSPKAEDLTETFRHIHGAIEELADVVRSLAQTR